MKRKGLLKTLLLLCALVVGSGSVWAEEGTASFTVTGLSSVPSSFTSSPSGFSMSVAANGGTAPAQNNGSLRLYCKNQMTITKTGTNKIQSVTFSMKINASKGKYPLISAPSGSFAPEVTSNSSTTTTWTAPTGGVDEITFTFPDNGSGVGGNWTFSGVSVSPVKTATTTTIDASGITNTAINKSTAAGSLSASVTVTSSGNAVPGATVTWTSSDEGVATISNTGVVTLVAEGTTTITASYAGDGTYSPSSNTYNLVVSDSRSANGLAFADAAKEVTVGEVLDAPTLTNPHSLSVTYSSDDETIATVDASGNVTGIAAGTTTIIATFAGDDDYKSGSVSYTLTVNKAPFVITDGVFDFRENEDYGSEVAKSGVKEQTSTWTAVNVTMYMEGRNCWYSGTPDNIRLYKASGGAAAGAITLSVPTGYVITKIDFTGASFNNLSAASGTFTTSADYKTATWEGISNSIMFTASERTDIYTITVTYIPIPSTLTHTVTSAGWATYAPAFPVSFAEHEAYIINIADDNEAVLTEVSSVPAGTAVLLKGAGEHTMTTIASSSTDVSDNCLKVSDGSITKDDNVYVLADGNYGVGFYLWIGETALSKGKIYMEPNAVTARVFIGLSEGGVLGIDAVNVHADREVIFDLQGRRVAQPKKGLYIVNGKKYAY